MSSARKIVSRMLTPLKNIKKKKQQKQRIDSLKRKIVMITRTMKVMEERINTNAHQSDPLVVRDRIRMIRKHYARVIERYCKKASMMLFLTKSSSVDAAEECGGLFLPLDIVANILSRLPAKSLTRFRCVCKQWRSLTYDPRFVKEQHERALEMDKSSFIGMTLRLSEEIPIYNFGPDREIEACSFRFSFAHEDIKLSLSTYTLSNSINGLIAAFCGYNRYSYHYLLNPACREVIQLPRCSRELICDHMSSLGLGFDEATAEYKLVRLYRIQLYRNRTFTFRSCACKVLTVGTQQWRYIGDVPCNFNAKPPVFLNGALHWVANAFNLEEPRTVVLAFDVKEEKFRFISIHRIIPGPSFFSILTLQKLEGHICLVKEPENPKGKRLITAIWMLRDYANHTWKEAYYVDMPYWLKRHEPYDSRIVDIKDGKIIQYGKTICSYDPHDRTLCKIFDGVSIFLIQITESIISPRNLFSNMPAL